MRILVAAALGTVVLSSIGLGQGKSRRFVVQPERIAVAMRPGDQLGPLTIEVTKTGWVSLSLLSTRPDQGLNLPNSRMMAEARDVKRWVARTRLMLEAPDTSKLLGTTTLGNGAYQLEIQRRRETPRSPHFAWKACGPGFGGTSPSIAEL